MDDFKVLTKKQVIAKLNTYVNKFETQREAAKKLDVSPAQLCNALNDSTPVPPKILKALGIERAQLYVDVKRLPYKYRDGSNKDL